MLLSALRGWQFSSRSLLVRIAHAIHHRVKFSAHFKKIDTSKLQARSGLIIEKKKVKMSTVRLPRENRQECGKIYHNAVGQFFYTCKICSHEFISQDAFEKHAIVSHGVTPTQQKASSASGPGMRFGEYKSRWDQKNTLKKPHVESRQRFKAGLILFILAVFWSLI